jgi:hypothetical protein
LHQVAWSCLGNKKNLTFVKRCKDHIYLWAGGVAQVVDLPD